MYSLMAEIFGVILPVVHDKSPIVRLSKGSSRERWKLTRCLPLNFCAQNYDTLL